MKKDSIYRSIYAALERAGLEGNLEIAALYAAHGVRKLRLNDTEQRLMRLLPAKEFDIQRVLGKGPQYVYNMLIKLKNEKGMVVKSGDVWREYNPDLDREKA